MERLDLFEGETSVRLADGRTRRVTVRVRQWTVANPQPAARLPVSGLVVFHLSGGEVTTEINGREQARFDGESWSLAPGATISLQSGTDVALVRTVEFHGLDQ